MRLAILGFGLIGGSIARALRSRGRRDDWSIVAWSPSGSGSAVALADGVIDDAASDARGALDGADLIVLAAPPLATLGLLDELGGSLRAALAPNATITDVASTKRRIVARAAELGLPFAGGHPMAGTEATGYVAADPDLFVDRPWVICPGTPEASARTAELAAAVGARGVDLDPQTHDAAVAAISHLPLLVSAALVEAIAGGRTPAWSAARDLAAGGWRDMSRLARGDPDMGAGILATNADNVAGQLRALREVIDDWLAMLDAEPDAGALRDRLERAREALK
jgi:prephenate dehydrogenase